MSKPSDCFTYWSIECGQTTIVHKIVQKSASGILSLRVLHHFDQCDRIENPAYDRIYMNILFE